MGTRELLAAFLALSPFASGLAAQGPVYRERWAYLYVERLRDRVFRELSGREEETRARVADLLAEDHPSPFESPARALALLRGVEADDALILRASVGAFVLPEVVDPVGTNEVCRDLNVTLFSPFGVPDPGNLAYAVRVRDAAGEEVFAGRIERDGATEDLRRARPDIRVPAKTFEDGAYRLEVEVLIDGEAPRVADPGLSVAFHVLRGYQRRAEAAMARARELHTDRPPLERALLLGLAAEVSRAYAGEAFDGVSTAPLDLVRLETALDNLANERFVLDGLRGDLPVSLPTGDSALACVLRLPDGLADGRAARPLLVFADGAPAYGVTAPRPTSPGVRGPRWLARELAGVGGTRSFDVAFLASPGQGRDYSRALPQALVALRGLLGTRDRPVVLVCEREAASVAALGARRLRAMVDGLVLIGGGALTPAAVDALADVSVRIAPLRGYPSSAASLRTLDLLERKRRDGSFGGDVALLSDREPAWPFGTRTLAPAIEAFAREVFGLRRRRDR